MKKWLIGFMILIFSVSLVSSLSMKISPTGIVYTGFENEKKCGIVEISSDQEVGLTVEDFWTSKKFATKNPGDYSLNASDLGIEPSYIKKIFLNKSESIDLCFNANNSGYYYGIVFFKAGNNSLREWVEFEVKEPEVFSKIKLTGAATKSNFMNSSGILFVVLFFVGFVFLIILIFFLRKKKPKDLNSKDIDN